MRALWIALSLSVLGVLVYSHTLEIDAPLATTTANPVILAVGDQAPAAADTAPTKPVEAKLTPTEERLSQPELNLDDDSSQRAFAIDLLATAPAAQAVPLLQKVLNGGGAETERQLALNSLRTLALNQGDPTGRIRNALRLVIYDGEDGAVTISAQAALEEIEYRIEPSIAR